MHVLVAGANGFVGSSLCKACIDRSWHVDGIIRTSSNRVPPGVSIRRPADLANSKVEYDVVFLAAGNFRLGPEELHETNVVLPEKITKLFPNARIVFLSSVTVYGNQDSLVRLDSRLRPSTPYAQSKLEGEAVVRAHPNASVIRFSNLYGAGMDTNLFIARMIDGAIHEKTITLFGDGSRMQDYLYRADAIEVCVRVAQHESPGLFLAAYGKSYSNKHLATIISKLVPDVTIRYEGKDGAPSQRYDPEDSLQKLGFAPQFPPERGLEEMIKQYE